MDAPLTAPAALIKKRHIAAVVTGNALEFYDFVTYSFFAVYIGRAFFPESLTRFSLLASLATFGVGFVMRPVGAYVIGRTGDRVGRKPAMLLSFSLMGFGIAGLALTPSYARIGVAAPMLVVLFRLMQGFALGGEVGPTTAFLIEAAPPERRGLYASLQYTTQDLAVLVAGLIGLGLANTLRTGAAGLGLARGASRRRRHRAIWPRFTPRVAGDAACVRSDSYAAYVGPIASAHRRARRDDAGRCHYSQLYQPVSRHLRHP